MIAILFVLGLVLLVVGAEVLVRGASRLAASFGVSPLVVGLTVVAFGTSAPELAVSVSGALGGQADVAVGNVVGSNIFNVLFILGLSALLAPLAIDQKLIRIDVPLLVAVSALTLGFAWDGVLGRFEGVLLAVGVVAYTAFAVWESRREPRAVVEEYEGAFGQRGPWLAQVGLVVAGLAMLVLGSRWFVAGAAELARWLGLSELVIGLTVVAVGTSLPEVATSVVATLRGERDIAVGNVIGSNLFNLLAVLGLSAVVAPGGLPVSAEALFFHLPVMLAVAVACLPIFFTGWRISRGEGLGLLAWYGLYTTWLVLDAVDHAAVGHFGVIMTGAAVATALALAATVAWDLRGRAR